MQVPRNAPFQMQVKTYKTDEWRKYFRDRYHAQKPVVTANLLRHRESKLAKFYSAIGDRMKCAKCPERDIACLDFHHLDPSSKLGNVANMAKYGSLDKALREAEKCEVLCSNCHRKLHYYE